MFSPRATKRALLDFHPITSSISLFATSRMSSISPQSSLHITLTMPRPINLMRGWPSPSLLPAPLLSAASQRLLADPAVYTPALQYGPDPGYQPLREGLARWLGRFYAAAGVPQEETTADGIIVTGGASQSAANVLATFTDPAVTKAVWVVAPCYYLACPIFEDAGFYGRLRATPEDEEGIDIKALESKMLALEEEEKNDRPGKVSPKPVLLPRQEREQKES